MRICLRPRLWVMIAYQLDVRRTGIGLDLFHRLAARDHTGHGRMLEAPGQRPGRHRHTIGHLFFLDLLHLPEPILNALEVPAGTQIALLGEPGARLILATQEAAGERDPSQNTQILFNAGGKCRLFGTAIQPVVDHLDSTGAKLDSPGHLMGRVDPGTDRDAQVTDLAGSDLLVEHGPEGIVVKDIVATRVKLVQVDPFHLQGPQRVLKLRAHLLRRPKILALQVTDEPVSELGSNDPMVALAPDRVANQGLGEMIPVALGSVNEVDAKFPGSP